MKRSESPPKRPRSSAALRRAYSSSSEQQGGTSLDPSEPDQEVELVEGGVTKLRTQAAVPRKLLARSFSSAPVPTNLPTSPKSGKSGPSEKKSDSQPTPKSSKKKIAMKHEALENTKDTEHVNEMKIQTMYKMVEPIKIRSGVAKKSEKKFLYLTNKQAEMITSKNISRCIEMLELGEPKCVIRLVRSMWGKACYDVRTDLYKERVFGYVSPNGCEIDSKDSFVHESQLALFMETCLLPLARRTEALIFVAGTDDCTLAASLERIVAPEQSRLGPLCKYKVISTATVANVYAKARSDPDSLAGQLIQDSPSWKARTEFLKRAFTDKKLAEQTQCDLSASSSHIILFEACDEFGNSSVDAKDTFDSIFLEQFTSKLPCLAIQTQGSTTNIRRIADLTSRGIPVLLLDSRERSFTCTTEGGRAVKTSLARKADSFPRFHKEAVLTLLEGELVSEKDKKTTADTGLTPSLQKFLVAGALEILEREGAVLADNATVNGYDISDLALLHSALHFGSKFARLAGDEVDLCLRIKELQELQERKKQSTAGLINGISVDLVKDVIQWLINQGAILDAMQTLKRTEIWLEQHADLEAVWKEWESKQELRGKEKEQQKASVGQALVQQSTKSPGSNDERTSKSREEEDLELKRIETEKNDVEEERRKKIYGKAKKKFDSLCALFGQDWNDDTVIGQILQTQLKRAIGRSYQRLVLALPEIITDEWSSGFEEFFQTNIIRHISAMLLSANASQRESPVQTGKQGDEKTEAFVIDPATMKTVEFSGPLLSRSLRVPSGQESSIEAIVDSKSTGMDNKSKSKDGSKNAKVTTQLHMEKISTDKLMRSTAVSVVLDIIEAVYNARMNGSMIDSGDVELASFDAEQRDGNSWNDLFQLLTSPFTHSASIYDIDECTSVLTNLVRSDRLPNSVSMEALLTLQDAWDHIELYHAGADGYKFATKSSYAILMLTGFIITGCALYFPSDSFLGKTIVLAMSLAASAVAAYVSFMNPAQRWQHLRRSALSMESEIWKFRTRVLEYRIKNSSDEESVKASDVKLHKTIRAIKSKVFEGADIKGTSFFSSRKPLNAHKQHAPGELAFGVQHQSQEKGALVSTKEVTAAMSTAAMSTTFFTKGESTLARLRVIVNENFAKADKNFDGKLTVEEISNALEKVSEVNRGKDDNKNKDGHYSSLKPKQYIKFRVAKAIDAYKTEIPKNNTINIIGKIFLTFGSIGSVVLVTVDLYKWAAAVSIFTSGVTAWLEFTGPAAKILQHSAVVDGLSTLIGWWNSLEKIEQSNIEQIEKLVSSCESIIEREHDAWASMAAQSGKLLKKATAEASKTPPEEKPAADERV